LQLSTTHLLKIDECRSLPMRGLLSAGETQRLHLMSQLIL
jgi:hypothetical protein